MSSDKDRARASALASQALATAPVTRVEPGKAKGTWSARGGGIDTTLVRLSNPQAGLRQELPRVRAEPAEPLSDKAWRKAEQDRFMQPTGSWAEAAAAERRRVEERKAALKLLREGPPKAAWVKVEPAPARRQSHADWLLRGMV